MDNNERLVWPDLLKIASIYCVIVIHSAAPLLAKYKPDKADWWWAANLYDSFSRWCIPVFFILSGMFLIEKCTKISLGHFLKTRLRRIAIPFVAWSGIYFAWRIYSGKENLAPLSFFSLLCKEPLFYHLWFVYVLIGLYLLAPILATYAQNATRHNLAYALSAWFVFASLVPALDALDPSKMVLPASASLSVFPYVGYFVLGYALRNVVPGTASRVLLFLSFLLAYGITAYGTYLVTVGQRNGIFNGILYEYWSPNVLIMAIAVFLIGKSIRRPVVIQPANGFLRAAADCVPGIYFVHALLISASLKGVLGFEFDSRSVYPALGIPLFALSIFAASFALTLGIKKVPLLRWIVP